MHASLRCYQLIKRAKDHLSAMISKILATFSHPLRIDWYYGDQYMMLPICGSPCYSVCSIEVLVAVAT